MRTGSKQPSQWKICLLLMFAALLTACTKVTSKDEIVGRYECHYPYGVEILDLRADGTYLQAALIDGQSSPLNNSGHWSYDTEGAVVQLDSALIVADGFGHLNNLSDKPQKGLWGIAATKRFGRILLQPNPDQDFEFRKI